MSSQTEWPPNEHTPDLTITRNKQINHFKDIKLGLKELTSLAKQTHKKIIDHLQEINHLDKLKAKWFDEVDLRGSDNITQQISYETPPDIVLEIISNKLCDS